MRALAKPWARLSLWWDDIRTRRRLGTTDGPPPRWRLWVERTLIALLVLILVYYPAGMLWFHKVDTDFAVRPPSIYAPEGSSRAIGMAATLVGREAERWMPNKPFFHPGWPLDNMLNFQSGMLYAISRFAVEAADQLGRTRASSSVDPDLDGAAGQLKYDGTIWYFGSGLLPRQPAEGVYRQAVGRLVAYNQRLARKEAVFDRRADNLINVLLRISSDLGSISSALEARAVESEAGWFDFHADDLFYNVKGRVYAYYMLLSELGVDFEQIIRDKQTGAVWKQMLDSLRRTAELDPLIVANAAEDSLLIPSHLVAQGFHLLRARAQLLEAADALVK